MKDFKKEAQAFAQCLETRTRGEGDDKKYFVCFTDEAFSSKSEHYEKISSLMYGFQLGQNFIYSTVGSALDEIAELESWEALEEWETHEFCDGLVDVYTGQLTEWLNESNYHVYYLEDAVNELGATDGFAILTGAQYLAIQEVVEAVKSMMLESKEA